MRTVTIEAHNEFAAKHRATSYFVCAKSGDKVGLCFRKVVAAITGVAVTKAELEQEQVSGGGTSRPLGQFFCLPLMGCFWLPSCGRWC